MSSSVLVAGLVFCFHVVDLFVRIWTWCLISDDAYAPLNFICCFFLQVQATRSLAPRAGDVPLPPASFSVRACSLQSTSIRFQITVGHSVFGTWKYMDFQASGRSRATHLAYAACPRGRQSPLPFLRSSLRTRRRSSVGREVQFPTAVFVPTSSPFWSEERPKGWSSLAALSLFIFTRTPRARFCDVSAPSHTGTHVYRVSLACADSALSQASAHAIGRPSRDFLLSVVVVFRAGSYRLSTWRCT